jgi:glycosyltransferase involved in cell wall biosynthesis
MPKWLVQNESKVRVILGMSPLGLLRRVAPIRGADVIYLPMVNRPFLTTLTFQLSLTLLLPIVLLCFAPDVVMVDYCSVPFILPWVLLRRLGLFRCSFVLDVRTLPVDTRGWRGWISNRRFDLSLWLAKRFMDGMTVITSEMRNTLVKRFSIAPSWVGVWESGVDVEKFQEARNRREELGWADKFVVMYHGTFSPNRGLQDAIAAFVSLAEEYPDLRLCLLGAGEALPELQALVKRLGLEDVVMIHPPVPYAEVADYIASADVGIVPLPDIEWWRTSSPLKLMEYLAAGKPVIVSRIAAHTAVLGDCPCACYLDRVSPEAIADGVRYFYGRRSELARLGSFGQQIVIQRYSWAAQARKLVDYLSTRTVRTGELAGSRVRDRYRQ